MPRHKGHQDNTNTKNKKSDSYKHSPQKGAMYAQEQNRNQQERLAKLLEKQRKADVNFQQDLLNNPLAPAMLFIPIANQHFNVQGLIFAALQNNLGNQQNIPTPIERIAFR